MGILFTVAGVGYFFGLVIAAANSPRDASGMIVAAVVIAILAGAFAFVSFRAFKSIALYLAQPAWCQELLSKTSS